MRYIFKIPVVLSMTKEKNPRQNFLSGKVKMTNYNEAYMHVIG